MLTLTGHYKVFLADQNFGKNVEIVLRQRGNVGQEVARPEGESEPHQGRSHGGLRSDYQLPMDIGLII